MNTMNNYKRRIEAIVHPIGADQRRKNTMRRELWAHLCALAEEEGGEEEAWERAWARLGEPDEIHAALAAAVPASERLSHTIERYVLRSSEESLVAFALRLGPAWLISAALFLALPMGLLFLLKSDPLDRALFVLAVLAPLFAWLFCVLLLLQPAMRFTEDMGAQSRAPHPLRTALAKALAALALALLLAPLFFLIGYGITALTLEPVKTLEFLYIWPLALVFVWSQLGLAVVWATGRTVYASERIMEWPYA